MRLLFILKSANGLSLDFKLLRSFVACSKFLQCSYFRLENYSNLKENLNLLNYIYKPAEEWKHYFKSFQLVVAQTRDKDDYWDHQRIHQWL